MKQILTASFLLISSLGITQQFIDRDQAIQLAIEYGIAEPLDSLSAILVNDTIWEVESLLCEYYNHTQIEVFRINAITGETYEDNYGRVTMTMPFGLKQHKTQLNYTDFVDSLLPVNSNVPVELLPDFTASKSQPIISPDNKWIAFTVGYASLGITSFEGESYKGICDTCAFLYWTEKENTLLYAKDKVFIEHNVRTDVSSIQNCNNRIQSGLYCHTGRWLAYIKSAPRPSENPNQLFLSINGEDNDLFILSLENCREIRITQDGYISNPVWNYSGDTLFFNKKDVPCYATGFNLSEPQIGVAKHLKNITVNDYTKSVDGVFPYIGNCQIYLVSTSTQKPIKYVVKHRGRYTDVFMSKDGSYIAYTMKKNGVKKIYLTKNE